ncbi:hypothetical protein AAHA92_13860 [Salvia divinorum]|uniref:Uncharacterized protein n=1 Tax=Salvia divinorum TaxID=28513 RepID=A0ABD1HDI6_SALDI
MTYLCAIRQWRSRELAYRGWAGCSPLPETALPFYSNLRIAFFLSLSAFLVDITESFSPIAGIILFIVAA